MFQVLVGSTSPAPGSSEMGTPELAIRREGSEVRVSVTLGPDSSANAETERAWLGRMATRYGGRFELEGGTESILLPADGATEQREMVALRRELEAAQRQGEAYARELAAGFTYEPSPPPRFTSRPADAANAALATVASLAAAVSATLQTIGSTLERELAQARERTFGPSEALAESMARLTEIVVDLGRVGRCPSYESAQHVNLADTVLAALAELEPRATRRGVTLKSHILPHADVGTRPIAAALVVRTLVADAIAATPHGGEVRVKLEPIETGYRLLVEDGGRPLSPDTLHALAVDQVDPSKVGRPATGAIACAEMLARHIRVELGVASAAREDGGPEGARVTLEFERA
jgi:signal transduction histidine kinase